MLKLAALLFLVGCHHKTSAGETVNMSFAAYRVPCMGESAQLCLSDQAGGYFYDGIEGFTFTWGTAADLRVTATPNPDPPADGSSVDYALASVIAERPATPGDTFTWSVDGSLAKLGHSSYVDPRSSTLMDGTPFVCDNASVCEAVSAALEAGETIKITFAFGDPVSGPLVLMSAQQ